MYTINLLLDLDYLQDPVMCSGLALRSYFVDFVDRLQRLGHLKQRELLNMCVGLELPIYTLTSLTGAEAPPNIEPKEDRPPDNTTWAIPPVIPPAKNAAPVLAIGVIELLGATLLITRPTREPAPIPFTTSPIIPVFSEDPIRIPPLRADLVYRVLRLTIVLFRGAALFEVVVFRLVVVVFRRWTCVFFAVFVFLFLNPPDFIIFANFLLAASCLAEAN